MKKRTPVAQALLTMLAAFVFATTIAFVLAGLSLLVMPKNNQAEFGMIEPVANGFLGEPGEIDVLIVGDSEVYSSFSPLQMWGDHGFTSYDATCAGQVMPYGFTLLRRCLKTHSPSVVLIETDTLYTNFSLGEGLFRLAQDLCPLLEYHNRWKSLGEADFTQLPTTTWTDELKGFNLDRRCEPADTTDYAKPTDEVHAVPRNNACWLLMMVACCRQAGATPVLVSAPTTKNWSTAKHNGIQQLADQLQVDYVDMNLTDGKLRIDWEKDTRDRGDHLNYAGARKATRYLGSYLKHHFDLPDRRKDDAYAHWNEALAHYKTLVADA